MGPIPGRLLFSYGRLRDPAVQVALFGAEVATTPDAVVGHRLRQVQITDSAVVALSGSDVHPGLVVSHRDADQVAGLALGRRLSKAG